MWKGEGGHQKCHRGQNLGEFIGGVIECGRGDLRKCYRGQHSGEFFRVKKHGRLADFAQIPTKSGGW